MPKDPKLSGNPPPKHDVGVELRIENIMPVNKDDLSDEIKTQIDQRIMKYENILLSTFRKTKHGKIIQKGKLPVAALIEDKVEKSTANKPIEVIDEATLNNIIHSVIHHALINHSPVLVNTLRVLIIQTVEGCIYDDPVRGPMYFRVSENIPRPTIEAPSSQQPKASTTHPGMGLGLSTSEATLPSKDADSGTVERTPRRIILQRTTPQTQPQFYRQETSELNVTYGTTPNVEPSLFGMPSSSASLEELGETSRANV
ncbi:hypothetical protein PR202_ga03610 [Eleusine coracana subsp. coracana]|uniref:Uncharacterized protein n=1 Tax=Eleusine coracana subsp. coracana TaxID=191504 RepID=A0AAV5BPI8_ELECO|nr:hypothetical protein PR202_ga03610 [Eleusine coracana subsp. coracana]